MKGDRCAFTTKTHSPPEVHKSPEPESQEKPCVGDKREGMGPQLVSGALCVRLCVVV